MSCGLPTSWRINGSATVLSKASDVCYLIITNLFFLKLPVVSAFDTLRGLFELWTSWYTAVRHDLYKQLSKMLSHLYICGHLIATLSLWICTRHFHQLSSVPHLKFENRWQIWSCLFRHLYKSLGSTAQTILGYRHLAIEFQQLNLGRKKKYKFGISA